MSKEANIATQLRMIAAVNRGELEVLHEIFAEDVLDHDMASNQSSGPAGYIAFFGQLRAAFPDLNIAIEHMIASEDSIAIAVRVTGTHLGTHVGVLPSSRSINVRGIQIARFNEHAQIQERWGSSDELGILRQIGAIRA